MFDPNAPLPDFESQFADIERKRMLADMLRKSSQDPAATTGKMVGKHYVPVASSARAASLVNALMGAYQEQQADTAERGYKGQVKAAREDWQSSLPQATAAIPPSAGYGSVGPEDDAVPGSMGTPRQPVDSASILKHTLAGLNIPGNEKAAGIYNQAAMGELTREDTQAARAEDRAARDQARREDLIIQLQSRREELEMKLADGRLTKAQEAELRKMHEETIRRGDVLMAEARRYAAEQARAAVQDRVAGSQAAAADKPPKQLPGPQAKAWLSNQNILKQIEDARREVKAYPNAVGYKGALPNWALQRTDPKGAKARVGLSKLSSTEVKDTSGTAVSGHEFERIRPHIPNMTDDAPTVLTKLDSFEEIVKSIQQNIIEFAEIQNYKSPTKPDNSPSKNTGEETKVIGNVTYVKRNGDWYVK